MTIWNQYITSKSTSLENSQDVADQTKGENKDVSASAGWRIDNLHWRPELP